MATKEIVSVAVIIAIIALFVSSSALVNPLLAKTIPDKGSTSTAKTNYKDFQMCLAKGEGTKGYATEQEIKQCNGKAYSSSASTGSSGSSIIPQGGGDSKSE
jgi:hypothetical protein